jgi:hypothetical protein
LMALSYACMDKDGMDRIQSSFSLKDLDDLPEDCEVGSLPWDNEEASSVARRLVRRAHFFPMVVFLSDGGCFSFYTHLFLFRSGFLQIELMVTKTREVAR